MDSSDFDIKALTPADFATDFMAGLIAGSAGLIVGHPFDTVKVILQTSKTKLKITSCVLMILKQEGPKGLFKGMAYPLASVGFLNSVFFGFNMIAGSKIVGSTHNIYTDIFFAGAVAGGVQAIPATPIDLVKVKLQAQLDISGESKSQRQKYTGPWDCLRKTYSAHGIRGCFHGLSATAARDISGFAIYMTIYKFLCDLGTPEGSDLPSFPVMLLAGGMTGVVSWMTNFPVDTVKSMMQSDNLQCPQYKSSIHCFRTIVQQNGVPALYKGFTAALLRSFPLNAVTLCTYDLTQRQMKLALKDYNTASPTTASTVHDV